MRGWDIVLKWIHIVLFLLLTFSVYSQDEVDEDEPDQREVELGFKIWNGYHAPDRFEGDLSRYKSITSNLIYSYTQMEPFRWNSGFEFFGKFRLYKHWKAGLNLGTGKFRNFYLNEIDSTGVVTSWNMHLGSDYAILAGYYEWFFTGYSIEVGAGLGVNTTSLKPSGLTFIPGYNPSESGGALTANGLSYRLETIWNKPITDRLTFQIGLAGTWHTAPYFSGSLTDDNASIYIRSDGTVGFLSSSEGASFLVNTEYAVRRLDMFYGYFHLNLGVSYKILFE